MRVLLVVDIQNDFLPGGALAVPQGESVIAVINRLQPFFEHVVATQDWHPASHGSFAANHPGRAVGDVVDLEGLPQILWPVHCVANTPGAALAPALQQNRFEAVFRKGVEPKIDSYSALYDNGHRRSTGLPEWLLERKVQELFICGLATDYCVKFSALDAAELGLPTRVVLDACRGIELRPGDIENALRELRECGVELVRSRELLS